MQSGFSARIGPEWVESARHVSINIQKSEEPLNCSTREKSYRLEKLAIGLLNVISMLLCIGHQQAQNISGRSVFLSFDPCKFDLLRLLFG